MTTRAKFFVESKKEHFYGDKIMITVEMKPVYAKHVKRVINEKEEYVVAETENTKFWQVSPSGMLELGCINLEVAAQFELGKEYYLDFTLAPKE